MKELFEIFLKSQAEISTAVLVMVCAVIVLMEVLKERVFNHIENKNLRRFALSFSSIALMYVTVATYFLFNGVDFKWFLPCGTLVCFAMIIIYWLYKEFLQVRDAVFAIGSFVIKKFFKKGITKLNEVSRGMEIFGSAIDGILKSTEKKNEIKKDDLTKL